MSCSVLKMKYIAQIVRLQRRSKELSYIKVDGKKSFAMYYTYATFFKHI